MGLSAKIVHLTSLYGAKNIIQMLTGAEVITKNYALKLCNVAARGPKAGG